MMPWEIVAEVTMTPSFLCRQWNFLFTENPDHSFAVALLLPQKDAPLALASRASRVLRGSGVLPALGRTWQHLDMQGRAEVD